MKRAFSVVELIIVIVVIGILASLVLVGYNVVTKSAHETALKSDLKAAAGKIELYKLDNKKYPETPADAGVDTVKDGSVGYNVVGVSSFCLGVTSSRYTEVAFSVQEDGKIRDGNCMLDD